MKMSPHLCFASVLLASCSTPAPVENTAELIKKVEAGLGHRVYLEGDTTWSIEERMAHYGVPGVSLAVIKDNKVAWVKSYGVMDRESKEPVTDSTLFQAGSISKPVAAYGALRLVQDGLLDLDANVNDQLRSWKLPDNEFTVQQKVTLKHLLSHTGGVDVHGFLGYSPDLPVPTLVQVLNGEPPANSPPIVVNKLPGEGYRYSGGGYCIAQQMMIDAKGGEFPAIMQQLVLGPLGMARSTYQQPLGPDRIGMAATGYLPDGSMTKGKRHTYPEMAAAGLWTTAGDLAKFAIDLQLAYKGTSDRVLSKATATTMLTPFVGEDNGLGIFLINGKEDTYFQHGGWDEGFCAQLMAHRDAGYGVVVLINANQPDFMKEVIRSVARAYSWHGYIPEYKKLPIDAASLASIVGRYKTGNNELITVSASNGRLFQQSLGKDPVELFRISDSTYISRFDDRPIQFKVDDGTGKMSMVVWDLNAGHVVKDHPRMEENEHVPLELVVAGARDGAVAAYRALMASEPLEVSVQEGSINDQGYAYMAEAKVELARDLFYVNMQLYPQSANVYDSYAEACMKNNELELALTNYKKAFAMDPKNENAMKMIREIRERLQAAKQ